MDLAAASRPVNSLSARAVRQLKELVSKQTRKKGAPETKSGSRDKSGPQKSREVEKVEKKQKGNLISSCPRWKGFAKQS